MLVLWQGLAEAALTFFTKKKNKNPFVLFSGRVASVESPVIKASAALLPRPCPANTGIFVI